MPHDRGRDDQAARTLRPGPRGGAAVCTSGGGVMADEREPQITPMDDLLHSLDAALEYIAHGEAILRDLLKEWYVRLGYDRGEDADGR